EARRCDGYAPRRIELPMLRKARQQLSVQIERVDDPVTLARDVVFRVLVLDRVGDEQFPGEKYDIEGGEAFGQRWIDERKGRHQLEGTVEDVHRACQSFVNGADRC